MYLFDELDRTTHGPAPHSISDFGWMNISADPYAAKVRQFFEEVILRYPKLKRESLIARFRSEVDSDHRAALFELIVFAWLEAQDHKVIEVEPSIDGSERHPDFLVEAPTCQQYYLEVTSKQPKPDPLAAIKDAVNNLCSRLCFDLQWKGQPAEPIGVRKVKNRVKEYLRNFDYSSDEASWEAIEVDVQGVKLIFKPSKLKPKGQEGSMNIGTVIGDAKSVSVKGGLDRLLKRKASRYGRLDKPYLVAVTTQDFTIGLNELSTALFGTLGMTVQTTGNSVSSQPTRFADGIWRRSNHSWTNTRLSGVLLFADVRLTSFARRYPIFMTHPEPSHSVDPDWFKAQTFVVSENEIVEFKSGERVGAVFDLPEAWPE